MSLNDTIQHILSEVFEEPSSVKDIIKLHGDASYRTYYRATLEDGNAFIVMQMPKGMSSVSEEITNYNGTHEELPFINVAKYLSRVGLPVPKIHHYSKEHHIMILEDLGDHLMAREVENAGKRARLKWYKRAIDLLVRLQRNTNGGNAASCIAFARSFDSRLLNWEFHHFLEYGIEARTGLSMDKGDRAIFEECTHKISSVTEQMPYGFTHRDFQSRNLIIKDDNLYMIDFQDALLGPAVYDLVALTRDSYVKLADDTVEELIEYYASLSGRLRDDILGEFDLVTVQRKLKDAGRFVYIDRVKGNPNFLKYIPTSLDYVRAALARLPEYSKLYNVLCKYVPEWK
jgi:aminoglycoside/choline kinase family phosphotransferase